MAVMSLDSRRARGLGLILTLLLSPTAGSVLAQGSPRETPPGDSADALMRSALASALQAQGRQAVAALRALDSTALSPRYVPTRRCMLERLESRRAEPPRVSDSVVAGVLGTYREYWLRSLREEEPATANERWLLDSLNALLQRHGTGASATLDSIESPLTRLIEPGGYHVLLGVTSPLRELMLWKSETEKTYRVKLPEGTQPVTVVFMDDFASLGWAGFATCDRHHTGGWTKPDRLYAVRSAYDLQSENFHVSYLAHEAQHFSDNHRFPRLDRQDELEYRAKLVELAEADSTVYDLLETFASNTSRDVSVPHGYANGRVVTDLGRRLFQGAAAPEWRQVSVARINAAAAELLRRETARLERAGGT